jgi:otoferlin
MSVDKPRIDVECSGNILSSSIIQNAKKNPNFANMLKFFDLELPVEETYAPPITIRCVDCRSFGRYTLVGTHQITSIHKYMHRPSPRESISKQNGHIVLSSDKEIDQSDQLIITTSDGSRFTKQSSCENLTLYGAACVGKV